MTRKFCVYVHYRESDGKPFYVGKGDKKRANAIARRSLHWTRVYLKHGRRVNIAISGVREECAFSMERAAIAFYGRKNLVNATDGGEGTSGRIPSKASRIKCSISNKGTSPAKVTILSAIDKNSKPVGTTCGLRFKSAAEAARIMFPDNIASAKSSISASCNGNRVSNAYGYNFRFVVNGKLADAKFKPKPLGKPVKTSCGMFFDNASRARDWLIEIGKTKAINSNITQNCKGKVTSAYGYKWSYV